LDFEWDPAKARRNVDKHGVDFADAVGVFDDEQALSRPDDRFAAEQRYVVIGLDLLGRVLTVAYTYRNDNIRLISARPATAGEIAAYERRR
jgi:hypothetical protein